MKKIGLVGGISWVSTIDYYRLINEGINDKLGGLNFAECLIYSLNFNDVQAVGWPHSFELLYAACKTLQQSGVTAIVLCANTAHQFADELSAKLALPVINIITETAITVRQQGLQTIGLLGTKFTMEMGFYRGQLEAHGLTVLVPEAQVTRDFIQQTVKEELGIGLIKLETKAAYITIIDELVKRGAEGIILGCTEIPMLITQADCAVPVFDTTKIHAKAATAYMLS